MMVSMSNQLLFVQHTPKLSVDKLVWVETVYSKFQAITNIAPQTSRNITLGILSLI